MNSRTRKGVGCITLVAYLSVYALVASSLGVALAPVAPSWAQLIYYAIAGVVWIIPLKPLFGWISRGDA